MPILGCFSFFTGSKWIGDLDHLITLVDVMIIIQMIFRTNPPDLGDIAGFVQFAETVVKACRANSRQPSQPEKRELHRMLTAISNNSHMGEVLGHRSMIGGSFWKPWSTVKMYCFLMKFMSKKFSPFVHDQSYYSRNLQSSDLPKIGALYRDMIRQIKCNGGRLFENHRDALVTARDQLSTPRNQILNVSSSSVGGSMSARTNASSFSSSSMTPRQTPLPTPRTPRLSETPRTPRELCKPQGSNFLLTFFMSSDFEFFFQSLEKSNVMRIESLKILYDMVTFYRRNYSSHLLTYQPLTQTFWEDMGRLRIIEQTLNDVSSSSLQIVAVGDRLSQMVFVEMLKVRVMYELWIEYGGNHAFTCDCKYGGIWKQNAETFQFELDLKVSTDAERVRAA